MSLFWKITVWVNVIWVLVGSLMIMGNGDFGWGNFTFGVISLATAIKCLELNKDLELANRKLEVKSILSEK